MFWFVGSLIVSSVITAALDPMSAGEPGMTGAEVGGYVAGVASYHLTMKLIAFVPLLLVLGGLFFVVASVRGGSPRFLEAVFDPRLMVLMVLFIVASAFTG